MAAGLAVAGAVAAAALAVFGHRVLAGFVAAVGSGSVIAFVATTNRKRLHRPGR